MDYYLNEYSLRGQFDSVENFFDSLRTDTLPVLKRIEQDVDSIVWKKADLWNYEICKGITLGKIPQKKNERSPELYKLKEKLRRLYSVEPFWYETTDRHVDLYEYQFDKEYCSYFEPINCFTKAIENDGRIISFVHDEYKKDKLPLSIKIENNTTEYVLDNLYNVKWWDIAPEVKSWRVADKYHIEVRANEFDYHPPHFHVSFVEYAAVFRLDNGELYRPKRESLPNAMLREIKLWYDENREELLNAWDILHGTHE